MVWDLTLWQKLRRHPTPLLARRYMNGLPTQVLRLKTQCSLPHLQRLLNQAKGFVLYAMVLVVDSWSSEAVREGNGLRVLQKDCLGPEVRRSFVPPVNVLLRILISIYGAWTVVLPTWQPLLFLALP